MEIHLLINGAYEECKNYTIDFFVFLLQSALASAINSVKGEDSKGKGSPNPKGMCLQLEQCFSSSFVVFVNMNVYMYVYINNSTGSHRKANV